MEPVRQMKVTRGMTVDRLVHEMGQTAVLGAGRVARAVSLMSDLFSDAEYTVFLTLAGPMIPGGLRRIVADLVHQGHVDAVIASGANIVHDVIEALASGGHAGGSMSDAELRGGGYGRIGDIYIEMKGFEALERKVYAVLDGLTGAPPTRVSICDLLMAIGRTLDDDGSLLRCAALRNVPVFSPGVTDSMLGLHMWTYGQLHDVVLDPLQDMNRLSDMVYESGKMGAIILGGGLPKHFIMGASTLKNGLDAAIQITLDRPEGGSLSGAPLEEGISWRKMKTESRAVTVISDATIAFPVIVAAALDRIDSDD
jgi:deoxyhypusine synthase